VVERLRRYQDRFGVRFTPAPKLVQLAESGGKSCQPRAAIRTAMLSAASMK